METIEARINLLKEKYINLAMDNENPIVKDLVDGFKNFKYYGRSHNNLKKRTPLCGVKIN